MSGDLLLAIDLGTTRLKVAAFEADGRLLALRVRRHREHRDGERAWQSAEGWWADACALVRDVRGAPELAGRELAGVALSGRGGAAVFIDKGGRVAADPWSDRRHGAELRELRRGEPSLSAYASALLAKTLWLRAHEPERFARVRHVLYAKDFLLYRLTGEARTDWTSGPDGPAWDDAALARSGIEPALLPVPALPWELAGRLTRRASDTLGCREGVPVAVGGHDGICANLGAGAATPGAAAITLGTHGVVRAVTERCPPGAFRFYGLPPGRHVIGGNALMAGRALEWLADQWVDAHGETRAAFFQAQDAAAAGVAPGADGVRFLPFLAGRVSPERRPGASAAFAGLRVQHGRPQLWRAVLEGTAFALSDIFRQVSGWCGPPRLVGLTGGGTHSPLWCQILADALGEPLQATDAAVEARGAAVLLAVGLGLHPDLDGAARAMVRVARTFEPDAARAAAYTDVHGEWRALADATRPLDSS